MRLDHESKSFNLLRNKYVVKVIRSANLLALLQKKLDKAVCKRRLNISKIDFDITKACQISVAIIKCKRKSKYPTSLEILDRNI